MAEGDLSDTIKQTAQGPSAVNIDGNSATAQDISKQIEAARYLSANQAVAKRHRGLRFSKLAAPGACFDGAEARQIPDRCAAVPGPGSAKISAVRFHTASLFCFVLAVILQTVKTFFRIVRIRSRRWLRIGLWAC